ncbi:MAG TPA: tetratricopeptide repeat protein [Candidatus Acidoferrum sp.]|nr:tetratricopeptide repeat protein [Candidatus Acidoferrum sp.]
MKAGKFASAVFGTVLFTACVCLSAREDRPSVNSSAKTEPAVTFNRDIAPMVFKYCAPCHRTGEAGPFPLLTYKDTAKLARQIAYITKQRIMPPWLPAPGDYKFQGELKLTDEQIVLFQKWSEEGAPQGAAADLPAAPKFVTGWQLGKPDLILRARKPYTLPATGSDNYWNFIFPADVDKTKWVKSIEIRPGEKRVVHHANILVDRLNSSRAQEKNPGDGFAGMELRIESESFDPDSHLFFWKPGSLPHEEPPGMALRLEPGNDFVLNTHLQPSGKPEVIEPSIGLYFTDQPATKFPILLELQDDRALDIPAGVANFPVNDSFTIPTDVNLLAIYPHAHYLGKELKATAAMPDGNKKTLIFIPRWDLNWQAVFYYQEPVFLPKGTVVSMEYVYDNSEANTANPFHPPQRVKGGNRTTDEMAHLWLQVLPLGTPIEQERARRVIQEAISRHDVERDPNDFGAQYNLAAMLEGRGNLGEALEHYQAAVRLRPNDAIANNGLGAALLAIGKTPEAIGPLEASIAAQPDYFSAHYNLGNALASMGKFPESIVEYQAAVKLNPRDSMAEANLGAALGTVGDLQAAREHLRRALEIDPNNRVASDDLREVESLLAERKK